MQGLIGSGFGLYGHLPAIAEYSSEPICIAETYRHFFESRTELHSFSKRLVWSQNEEEVLRNAHNISISVWPLRQEELIEEVLASDRVKLLFLEKPLASSPLKSRQLLKALIKSGITFRINYSLIYTEWYAELVKYVKQQETIELQLVWDFRAYHYKNEKQTWKRIKSMGGSVVRFYGIHVIAMLVSLNFNIVINSQTQGFSMEDVFKWKARIKYQTSSAAIEINSNSQKENFNISVLGRSSTGEFSTYVLELKDPFSYINRNDNLDPRIEVLKAMYFSSDSVQNKDLYPFYSRTNALWDSIESLNQNIIIT